MPSSTDIVGMLAGPLFATAETRLWQQSRHAPWLTTIRANALERLFSR